MEINEALLPEWMLAARVATWRRGNTYQFGKSTLITRRLNKFGQYQVTCSEFLVSDPYRSMITHERVNTQERLIEIATRLRVGAT